MGGASVICCQLSSVVPGKLSHIYPIQWWAVGRRWLALFSFNSALPFRPSFYPVIGIHATTLPFRASGAKLSNL